MAGLIALSPALATGAGEPACPAPQAALMERWLPADCSACWAQASAPAASKAWQLDWIVPAGPDAALSVAALPEAAERAARLFGTPTGRNPLAMARQAAAPAQAWRLQVQSGPAWSGYMALQLSLRARPAQLPAGSTGWMALVEAIPAGADGSPVQRSLVRAVTGPLPLTALTAKGPLNHLAALRWPDNTRPERLRARAWVEDAAGQVLAMAADRCD